MCSTCTTSLLPQGFLGLTCLPGQPRMTTGQPSYWKPGKGNLRICLIVITITCSRLRRSLVLVYRVENARRAFSTRYTKTICAAKTREPRQERAKTLRIRHALSED